MKSKQFLSYYLVHRMHNELVSKENYRTQQQKLFQASNDINNFEDR